MRTVLAAGVVLTVLGVFSTGRGEGQAHDRDQVVITVKVSSAEHEAQEGYFTLGDSTTVMVKPGSDLYKFLSRHRGRDVRITLTDAARPGLSRLDP